MIYCESIEDLETWEPSSKARRFLIEYTYSGLAPDGVDCSLKKNTKASAVATIRRLANPEKFDKIIGSVRITEYDNSGEEL